MKIIFLLISFLLLATSCGEKTKKPYDRKGLLTDIGEKAILPSFKTFKEKAAALSVSLNQLKEKFDDTNLASARKKWQSAALAWSRCELFNMSPFKDTYIKNKVSTWPTKVSTIERVLAGNKEEINRDFIDSRGSNSKGLFAIEYLLFDEVGLEKVKVLPNHLAYLTALGEDLRFQAEKAYKEWSVGNYSFLIFYVQKDDLEMESSLSLTLNEMIALIERVYISKLSKPLGKDGHLNLKGFEAWRSQYSLDLIKENIEVLEDVYKLGFYDYLDYLNLTPDSPLSDKLKKQFQVVRDELGAITVPLEETAAADPTKLDALIEKMRDLLVLIKVDSANQMGVTVTFNDNDGD